MSLTSKQAALRYAKPGIPVFPLHGVREDLLCTCGKGHDGDPFKVGKHPRTGKGFQDGSTNLRKVAHWWTQWPDANIGLVTGTASGFWVLDVDPRHGGDASLDAWLL